MTNKKNILYFCRIVTRSFFIGILCFMLIPGFLFFVYMGDLLLFSNNNQMKNPLFGAYVIVSPSMVPTISVNDGIVIKRVDNDKYKVGDTIKITIERDKTSIDVTVTLASNQKTS